MPKRVRLPDGRVLRVPDDATDDQIRQAVQQLRTEDQLEGLNVDLTQEERRRFAQAGEDEQRDILARAAGREAVSEGGGGRAALRDFLPFGLGTLAGATGQFLGQQVRALAPGNQEGLAQEGGIGQRFGEALEAERGRTRGLREENPGASAAGAVAGSVAGGTGLARLGGNLLRQAAGRGGQVGRLANLGRLQQGQTGANVIRTGAAGGTAGAAEGASRAAVEGGDVSRSAGVGAGTGAVLGPAASGLTRLAGAGIRRLRRSTPQGFRVLARRISPEGTPNSELDRLADDLRQRADQFREDTGRAPRITEILSDVEADDINVIGRARPEAGAVLEEGAQRAAQDRQRNLPAAIVGRRARVTSEDIGSIRDTVGDRLFGQIADREVPITDDLQRLLSEEDVLTSIRSRDLRRRVAEAADGDGSLRVRDVDDLRQALGRRVSAGEGRIFQDLRDELVDVTAQNVPEFQQAIQRSSQLARAREGFDEGQRAASRQPVSVTRSRLPEDDRTARAGARAGFREGLTTTAEESPQGAARTAQRLSEEGGVRQRARDILGDQEGERVIRAGEAEARAGETVSRTRQGVRQPSRGQAEERLSEDVADILFAGRAGGAFNAQLASQFSQRLSIPPVAAQRLAEAITDPNRTDEAIGLLRQAGNDIRSIEDVILGAANATGINFGRETAQATEDQ